MMNRGPRPLAQQRWSLFVSYLQLARENCLFYGDYRRLATESAEGPDTADRASLAWTSKVPLAPHRRLYASSSS